ncbi:MAG TPA: hypothetical protein VGD22_05625 [Sphingobacteriaceae bacterium]
MTEQTQNDTLFRTEELKVRNKEVTKCFDKVVEASKLLLKPFNEGKYRTTILVDHANSGQDTNLISEFLTCFFNITLTKNKMGYVMIYIKYDNENLERFGARLYNRVLRQLFKHTMSSYAQDAVRVNNPSRVEPFFLNRLGYGVKPHVKISTVEKT